MKQILFISLVLAATFSGGCSPPATMPKPIVIITPAPQLNTTPSPWPNVDVYTDNDTLIRAYINHEFAIGLIFNSNSSRPYSWSQTHDENMTTLVDEIIPVSTTLNGTQWFRFKALKPGITKINFTYVDILSSIAPPPNIYQQVFSVEIKYLSK